MPEVPHPTPPGPSLFLPHAVTVFHPTGCAVTIALPHLSPDALLALVQGYLDFGFLPTPPVTP